MRNLIACLLAAALLAGCQGRPQPQPPAPNADSLHVVRRSPLRFLAPLDKTIADKAAVQQLHADLQAMPAPPSVPMSCPADNGVTLDLTFLASDSPLLAATANASGCRSVRFIDGSARLGTGPEGQRFFTDLAKALGLSGDVLAGFGPQTPPKPAGNGSLTASTDLLSVQMMGAETGWAVSADNVYRTIDSGVTWTKATPPGMGAAFFLTPDTAWVTATAKDGVTVYRTSDGGRTWKQATVPVQTTGGAQVYFLRDGSQARDGWLWVPEGAAMMHEAAALYHSGDGGATWSKVAETHPEQPQPGEIPFVGDKTGFAFLDSKTGWITGYTPVPGHVYLYVTHDGGKTWAEQSLPVPGALAQQELTSLPPRVFGEQVAVLPVQTVDSLLLYVTHDGGATWTAGAPVKRTQPDSQLVWDFADVANGLVADGNRLWVTNDGGKTWSGGDPVPALQDVRQLDLGIGCWALTGQQPPTRLHLSTDGCQTWAP